jgi:hypothetical protein
MNKPGRTKRKISRREFARGGALAAASVSAACLPAAFAPEPAAAAQMPANEPALTTAAQAEVDAKVSAVIRKYGNLLSDAEKLDVRRLLTIGQKPLDQMRTFAFTGIDNSDQPGNVLHLYPDAPAAAALPAKGQAVKTSPARGRKP